MSGLDGKARPITAAIGLAVAAILAAGAAGCRSEEPKRPETNKVRVFVSIPPEAYFVRRVGGEHVAVTVLVQSGQDPHTFEATARQAVQLSEAQAYFAIGLPFEEQLLEKIRPTLKGLRIVDISQGVAKRKMEAGEEEAEEHEGHAHEHGELDPHVWLDPKLAKGQAAAIAETLSQLDPPHKAEYEKNLQAFQADLDAVDRRIAEDLAPLKGRTIYVFHPAFGYFCASYGLKQQAVETGGKEPSPKQVLALIEQAKADGVKVIFVQPQFSDKAARAIAGQIGGAVVPIDPLAEDYLANLQRIEAAVRSALAGGK